MVATYSTKICHPLGQPRSRLVWNTLEIEHHLRELGPVMSLPGLFLGINILGSPGRSGPHRSIFGSRTRHSTLDENLVAV